MRNLNRIDRLYRKSCLILQLKAIVQCRSDAGLRPECLFSFYRYVKTMRSTTRRNRKITPWLTTRKKNLNRSYPLSIAGVIVLTIGSILYLTVQDYLYFIDESKHEVVDRASVSPC